MLKIILAIIIMAVVLKKIITKPLIGIKKQQKMATLKHNAI